MKQTLDRHVKNIGLHLGIDFRYFLKNGSWILVRQFLVALFSLLVVSFLSHHTDKEVFGKYQFVLSVISVMMIFSLPGMNTALVQAVARKKDGFYKEAFQTSLRSSYVGCFGLIMIALYFFWRADSNLGAAFLIIALTFPFLTVFGLWESFLQGQERFDLNSKNASLVAFVQSLCIICAIYFFPEYLIALIIGYAFSLGAMNVYFYQKSRALIRNEDSEEEAKKYGFFVTKMSVWGLLSEQVDKILIGLFIGPGELAIYTIVSFFGTRIKDIVRSFSSMLVPKMTLEESSFRGLLKTHQKTFLLLFLLSCLGSGVFFGVVSYVNSLVFSDTYAESFYLSGWYTITIVLSLPLTFMGYYIYAKKNTYALKLSNTVFHIVRICINTISIYAFGLTGAVIAYNLSMLLLLGVYIWGIYHEEEIISSQ